MAAKLKKQNQLMYGHIYEFLAIIQSLTFHYYIVWFVSIILISLQSLTYIYEQTLKL